MIVNFRTCGISRGTRKLLRTTILIKKFKLIFMCINIKFSVFIVELQRGEETNKSREI